MSTHILDDVERVCDTIGIINHGRLVVEAKQADLRARYSTPAFELECVEGGEQALLAWAETVRRLPWVTSVLCTGPAARVVVKDVATARQALLATIVQAGLTLQRYEVVTPSLEDIFLRLVGEEGTSMMAVTALRKEILEQWRTYRLFLVSAVLVAFGMLSPLLAKITPELFRMLPGGEQFASVMPAPTVADAIAQYIKNINQFAFLLALLTTMGAVAQEKERGTAVLMLVKPLGRGTFLGAKFAALALTYLIGILLAGLAAYYYTMVLFGAPDAGAWLLMNLLLWLHTTGLHRHHLAGQHDCSGRRRGRRPSALRRWPFCRSWACCPPSAPTCRGNW